MTEPRSRFTDPIAAIEEAQWLANQTLRRYGVFWGIRGMTVRPMGSEPSLPLEIVYPTTKDYIDLRSVDKN